MSSTVSIYKDESPSRDSSRTSFRSIYKDILKIGYNIEKKLGEGSFGQVYQIKNDKNIDYAIKLISYDSLNVDDNTSFAEIYFMKLFNHPNIISSVESGFIGTDFVYNIMELADFSLDYVIDRSLHLKESDMYKYIHQIADAIHYIHRGGFVHCDVKTYNILVKDGNIKIADLGLVRDIKNNAPLCQTSNYRSPEQFHKTESKLVGYKTYLEENNIILKNIPSVKSEYWSLGILFLDILYSTSNLTAKILDYKNFLNLLVDPKRNIFDELLLFLGPSNDDDLLRVTCEHLLNINPYKRNIVNFLEDPIFSKYGYGHSKVPFIFPSVTDMYLGEKEQIKNHKIVIEWINEIITEIYKHDVFILMNSIDFYIQNCHKYNKSNYQLLAIASVFLISNIFNPNKNGSIDAETLLYLTDNTYTINEFGEMINEIQVKSSFFPKFESLYLYLSPHLNLLNKGLKRMLDIEEYIGYKSPRYLADQIRTEESDEEIAKRLKGLTLL